MNTRRTTLAADPDDLAVLAGEARRRGISLARLLRELVSERAEETRSGRRPRFGLGRSGGGASQAAARDEKAPVRARKGT